MDLEDIVRQFSLDYGISDPRRHAVITNLTTRSEGVKVDTATQPEPSMVNIWCNDCSAFLETVPRGEEDSVRDYCTTCDPDAVREWDMGPRGRVQPVEGGLADEAHTGGEAETAWFTCDTCGGHRFTMVQEYFSQEVTTDTADDDEPNGYLWFSDPRDYDSPEINTRVVRCDGCDDRQDSFDVG